MPDALQTSTPLDLLIAQQLPGMGEYALPEPCDEEELERLPVHTASRLAAAEPARYALAAALFFGGGLGVRMICKTLRLSPHTLGALITAESRGITADRWRTEQSSDLRVVVMLASSALKELLLNPDAVDIAGIKGVATLLDKATHAHELLSGKLNPQANQVKQLSDEEAALAYVRAQRCAQTSSIPVQPMDCGTGKEEGSREGARATGDDGGEASHD